MKKICMWFAVVLVQCGLMADGATTLMVGTPADGTSTSPLTLREAIAEANNDANPADFPYVIKLPIGTYILTQGELQIGESVGSGLGNNVVIVGLGAFAQSTVIQQNGRDHVFDLDPNIVGNSTFAFGNLTIEDGSDTDTTSPSYGTGGGGIITGDAGTGGDKLLVTNCIFLNNTSQGGGSSIAGGAAINSQGGNVILNGCSFAQNTLNGPNPVTFLGGAVCFVAVDRGDTLAATSCQFTNNSTSGSANQPGRGGGVATLGSVYVPAANFTNCVFNGNFIAAGSGPGAGGGALYLDTNTLNNVIECTFVSNHISGTGTDGGAILVGGNSTNVIKYCRFAYNSIPISGSGTEVALIGFSSARGSLNANDNWWSADSGPAANALSGTVSPNAPSPANWLFLTNTASASPIMIGQTSTLTASFLRDSAGSAIASVNLTAMMNVPVSFTGTDGAISSPQPVIEPSGTATATFTGTTAGSGSGAATVDGVTSSAPIRVSASAAPTTVAVESVSITNATLRVTGTPTLTYQVLASDDLKTWTAIGSVLIPSGGSTNFVDLNVSEHTNRFYETEYP